MNKNHKIAIALAAIVLPLVAFTALYPPTTSDSSAQNVLLVDFSVYPENEQIVVERGKITQIPLKVEAPIDAEKSLQVRITYDRGNADPEKLQAALSKATVVLSKLDVAEGRATELGGMAARDGGLLILTPAANMSPGIYTIGIEAEQQIDSELADKLGSGTLVTVEVR